MGYIPGYEDFSVKTKLLHHRNHTKESHKAKATYACEISVASPRIMKEKDKTEQAYIKDLPHFATWL